MKNLLLSLLALALFVVMIGVSFMKAERANRIEPRAVEESLRNETTATLVGSAENAIPSAQPEQITEKPAETAQSKVDQAEESPGELAGEIVKQEKSSADTPPVILTVSKVDSPVKKAVDESEAKSQSSSISPTETTEKPEEKPEKPEETEKVVEENPDDRILDYFQERLNLLPTDLTSYEKKVAIKEVRDDVCQIFKITRANLKKLTKKRTIKYP